MILAVVGSYKISLAERIDASELIFWATEHYLNIYGPDLNVISGGADGVDTSAREVAWSLGVPFHEYLPENNRWEPNGFKARNIIIAETCDSLLCIRSQKSKTYGSGWTADRAERLGKRVFRYLV